MEIIDNGVGINEEHLDQVFVNGFTTKRNFRGFGLHYCANVMKEINGRIEITSDGPDLGATVSLLFPRYRAAEEEH